MCQQLRASSCLESSGRPVPSRRRLSAPRAACRAPLRAAGTGAPGTPRGAPRPGAAAPRPWQGPLRSRGWKEPRGPRRSRRASKGEG